MFEAYAYITLSQTIQFTVYLHFVGCACVHVWFSQHSFIAFYQCSLNSATLGLFCHRFAFLQMSAKRIFIHGPGQISLSAGMGTASLFTPSHWLFRNAYMDRVLIVFLFSILNQMWHFSDKRPSHGGIDNVMLPLLIHYRCLSFFVIAGQSPWLEMEWSLVGGNVWHFLKPVTETCSKRRFWHFKSIKDLTHKRHTGGN